MKRFGFERTVRWFGRKAGAIAVGVALACGVAPAVAFAAEAGTPAEGAELQALAETQFDVPQDLAAYWDSEELAAWRDYAVAIAEMGGDVSAAFDFRGEPEWYPIERHYVVLSPNGHFTWSDGSDESRGIWLTVLPRPLNKADFEFVGYVDDESLAEKYAKVAGGIWDIEITAGGQVVPSKLIDAPFGSTEVTVKLGSRYTWADGTRDLYKTTWNLRGRADKPPAGYNLDKGTGDERFWEGLVNQRYYRVLFDQGTPPSTLDEMTFGDHVVRFILNDHCEWKDGTIDEISGTWSVRGVVPVPSLDLSFVAGSQAISTWAMSAIQNVNYAYSSDELSFKMADQWMPGVYDISVKPAAGGKWNDTYGTEERTVTLTVLPRDLANAEVVIAPYVKKYDGTPRKPGVTVRWNGQDLVENVDYKVSYSKNVNAGTARVNIFGIGLYESTYKVVGFEIDPAAVSASKMALGKTVYTYTGKAIKPAPVVTYGDAALVAGQDYTVTYSGGCKSAGVYKATVTCTGNYSGSKTFTFRIKPKAACVKKATAGKGKVTVTLGGKPAVTGGTVYQISYRAKGAKTWKTVKTTAGSKTIKQLKKGKRYYVKARAYKKVGSTVLYGSWSKAKLSGIVK